MFPLSVFRRKKEEKIPLAMVALSDAPSAQIACDAGLDAILVGDSLGNTALGFDSTIPVTMDMMAHHVAAVVRGVKSSSQPDVPIIADMPFGSYATVERGVESAVRLMQLGAHAVKIEGLGVSSEYGQNPLFLALGAIGIPVMGHIGFTPQSQLALGSVVQGKTREAAQKLIGQARQLEEHGCFALVLEAMTEEVARKITERSSLTTVGIGAGSGCDGQVLVWHDLLGISASTFKMAKAYAQTRQLWMEALKQYRSEVQEHSFPSPKNSWQMAPEELEKWRQQGTIRNEEYSDEPSVTVEPLEGEPFQAIYRRDEWGQLRRFRITPEGEVLDEEFFLDDSNPFADN
jgi:3-methyl-2-oxobutanoate hydroxymethyltransferase